MYKDVACSVPGVLARMFLITFQHYHKVSRARVLAYLLKVSQTSCSDNARRRAGRVPFDQLCCSNFEVIDVLVLIKEAGMAESQ